MSLIDIALTGFLIWSGMDVAASRPATQIPPRLNEATVVLSVKLTGYNAVPEQTDGDPHMTASGALSNPEVIAARSRDLAETLPYGTVIVLEAPEKKEFSCGFKAVEHLVGYRVIADSMHERKEGQVDVMFDSANVVLVGDKTINPAVATGICKVTVRVVGKIPVKDIPETQAELAKFVNRKFAMR